MKNLVKYALLAGAAAVVIACSVEAFSGPSGL
jgi:hypothetical protein